MKGTQLRSPLHQHSVKNIHQVIEKNAFQSLGSERETINLVPKIVPIIPANNAGVGVVFSKVLSDPVILKTL